MDSFACHNVNGVLNARLDVLPFERRLVIPDDRLWRNAIANQFQHSMNRNSGAGDAGFSEMNFRAHLDSTHSVNIDSGAQEFNIHHGKGTGRYVRTGTVFSSHWSRITFHVSRFTQILVINLSPFALK